MAARKRQRATSGGRSRKPRAGTHAGRGGAIGTLAKRVLFVLVVAGLFAAALYGLLAFERRDPSTPASARDGAPPIDHIDESSRDKLRDILREEGED